MYIILNITKNEKKAKITYIAIQNSCITGRYHNYSINHPGRLLNFWTLRVGVFFEVGSY